MAAPKPNPIQITNEPTTQPEIRVPIATHNPPRPVPPPIQPHQNLFLIFQGERYPIDKDEFIIGRSRQASDLVISHNDISRHHASIIRKNGYCYIKDNNSVNGIEYNGQRIQEKRIQEGDVFWLADYELRFTYR